MYLPMSLKAQEKKATICATWKPITKYNGIGGKNVNIGLNNYIDTVWKHIFEHGMGDDCAFHHGGTTYNFIQDYTFK